MAARRLPVGEVSESALFLRLWDGKNLTPALARQVLKLGWSPNDDARMHALAVKNREGGITPAERRELDTYVRVGLTLSILQSRARRKVLAAAGAAAAG